MDENSPKESKDLGMDTEQEKLSGNLPETEDFAKNAPIVPPEVQEDNPETRPLEDGSMSVGSQETSQVVLETASDSVKPSKPYDKKWHILLVVVLGVVVLVIVGALLVIGLKNNEVTDEYTGKDAENTGGLIGVVDEGEFLDESTSILDIVGRDLTKEEALARECAVHPDFSGGFAASHWDAESQIFTSSMADSEYVWVSCDWRLALVAVPNMIAQGRMVSENYNVYAYFDGITTDTNYYTQYQGKGLPEFYQNFVDGETTNFGLVGVSRMLKQDFDEVIASGGVMGSVALLLEHDGFQYLYAGSQAPYSDATEDDSFLVDWEIESRDRLLNWVGNSDNWVKF